MSLRKYFQTCLDLPGVAGAFCLDADGNLIESFMPSPYTDAIFSELGPRIASLTGAVDMSYAQTNELLIRFETHALFVFRNEDVTIGFFTAREPLISGLRVSANLLLKQGKQAFSEALASRGSSGESESAVGKEPDDDIGTDEIVIPSNSKKSPSVEEDEEPEEPVKRGLFGRRKKNKPKPSKDIWG